MPVKSTAKSTKSTKNVFFSLKSALSALQSTQNEPLEGQDLKSSSQKASNTPSNHSYNTFETLFSYIHTPGKHRKVDKITKKRVSVQNCTKCSAEHSKRAVGGSKFDLFYSNLATHTPHTLYNMIKTLFSYIHYCKKHWKVEKITKNVFFCLKSALSALQSTRAKIWKF